MFLLYTCIGVDLGGSPGAHPQYLRNAQAFISFYHNFPPKFGFAPPIFLPSLCQCLAVYLSYNSYSQSGLSLAVHGVILNTIRRFQCC